MRVGRGRKMKATFHLYSTRPEICVWGGDDGTSDSRSNVLACKPLQELPRFIAAIAMALIFSCLSVRPLLAHVSFESGPYDVVVGWSNEPVIVAERNGITVSVTEEGVPVLGLATSLEIEIRYAGRTFLGNLAPTDLPGVYEAEVYPTVQGQYEVKLTGTIGDTKVYRIVEPEEVLPGKVLQFPEAQPSPRELQLSINDLDERVRKSYMLAAASAMLGLLAVGGLVFSYVRRQP